MFKLLQKGWWSMHLEAQGLNENGSKSSYERGCVIWFDLWQTCNDWVTESLCKRDGWYIISCIHDFSVHKAWRLINACKYLSTTISADADLQFKFTIIYSTAVDRFTDPSVLCPTINRFTNLLFYRWYLFSCYNRAVTVHKFH